MTVISFQTPDQRLPPNLTTAGILYICGHQSYMQTSIPPCLFPRRPLSGIQYHLSMHLRRTLLRLALAFACLSLTLSLALAQTAKRPINHHDYDSWRTIAGQRITNDGKFLAYSLFPEEGDGEVVIRNLVTGKETRIAAGSRPVGPAAATEEEEGPPVLRGVTIEFSADSKTVVFSTFPSKADTIKAKKDKKTADQMPKDGMVIVDLATGGQTRIERVRRFAMPLKGAGYLAYLHEAPEGRGAVDAPKPDGGGDYAGDQQGGRGGRGGR